MRPAHYILISGDTASYIIAVSNEILRSPSQNLRWHAKGISVARDHSTKINHLAPSFVSPSADICGRGSGTPVRRGIHANKRAYINRHYSAVTLGSSVRGHTYQ